MANASTQENILITINHLNIIMRHFRRRSRGPRTIIRSYKKVLNFAPVSSGAGVKFDHGLAAGADSVPLGQTGPTDNTVPTGSIIDYIEIQWGVSNLAAASNFVHITVQNLVSGQAATVSPILVGGNPQRNQVHHQEMRSIGQGQNMTFVYKFKVPKMLQRMREGSQWFFTVLGTAAYTHSCQVIYKVKM